MNEMKYLGRPVYIKNKIIKIKNIANQSYLFIRITSYLDCWRNSTLKLVVYVAISAEYVSQLHTHASFFTQATATCVDRAGNEQDPISFRCSTTR